MAVIWPKKKVDMLDRNLCNRPNFVKMMGTHGLEFIKVNALVMDAELDKFLLIPQVQSAFCDDDAEGYLDNVREAC